MEIFNYFSGRKKRVEVKDVPTGIAMSDTENRGVINKVHIPQFLVKPPFGFPRNKDIGTIRRLANSPQAAMGRKAILDVISEVPWDIVAREGFTLDNETTAMHAAEVKAMFINPNDTKETFNDIQKQVVTDMIDINAGIINKEFNKFDQFVGFRSVDGGTMLMNPNRFGKFTDRKDLILDKNIFIKPTTNDVGNVTFSPEEQVTGVTGLSVFQAAHDAAYFQFPWRGGGKPIPFGVREIVWLQENPVSYDIYGISVFEYLVEVLQTLVYLVEYELDYFEDNNIPKGVLNFPGAEQSDIDDFADRWNENQMVVNATGQLKKAVHRAPITNFEDAKFEKIQFSPQELDFISATKLFQKMVWGMLGVMPSDVGFTEDSNRSTEVSQDKKFLRRAILPRLKVLEDKYNQEIIPEFGFDDVEFKFKLFNVDDETSKANLYALQTAGKAFLTVNEIRRIEGLDEIEGADDLGNESSLVQSFDPDTGDTGNADTSQGQEEGLEDEKDKQIEGKALTTASPVTLGPFEVIGTIRKRLRDKKKELMIVLRNELKNTRMRIVETKQENALLKFVDDLFTLDDTKASIDQATEAVFTKNFRDAEKKLGQNLTINKEQIAFLSNNTFNEIKGMAVDIKDDLRGIIQRGLINGLGVSAISEQIKAVFEMGENRTEMIARTETNRAENQGQLQAMKASGVIDTKTWKSTIDGKTTGICQRLNGQTVPIDGKFVDPATKNQFDSPPALPNCRSTLLFDFEPEEE